jgi:hypothetical protein
LPGESRRVLLIVLGLLGLALLGLGLFFLGRRLRRSPDRAAVWAAGKRRKQDKARSPQKSGKPGPLQSRRESPYKDAYSPPEKLEYGAPLMLKLFVADQNTLIGKRNTHLVKPGLSYTVGGGRSDFLIFLVPVPPHIGELKYESSGCTFYPRRPEYFPGLGAEPVRDCVGKIIRVISDKGYELFLRLEQYEDPLVKLNRLMHSISLPPAPEA